MSTPTTWLDELRVKSYREAPQLRARMQRVPHSWPELMLHARGPSVKPDEVVTEFGEFSLYYLTPDDELVAHSHAIAFRWDGDPSSLPAGWTEAVERGMCEHRLGVAPNCLCALGAEVTPAFQRRGLSMRLIAGMKALAAERGFELMVGPVRPFGKARYPLIELDRYAGWQQGGEPFDPWIRVHYRNGGRIVRMAPRSLEVEGSVAEWEAWTGMAFPESAAYVVSGALTLVDIDVDENVGRYWDPNVWMAYDLR